MKKAKRMTKEQTEKKKKNIIRTFIVIISLIVIAIIGYIANEFIILDNNKTINLIINNKNVTGNLKKDVLVQDDDIYLSMQDLQNFFDKYIYEDTENNQIITTYEDKIAVIGFEENKMIVNGSEKSTFAHALKQDDTIYLPITEMKDVYGIDIEYIEKTKKMSYD